jgi:hypothetical protein
MNSAQQPLSGRSGQVPFKAQRILLAAFAAGVAIFAGVVAFIASSAERDPDGATFDLGVPHVAVTATLSVLAVALPFLVRSFLGEVPRERREEALAEVASGFVPREIARAGIVGGALAEAPGLLACVLALLTEDVTLLTAAAISVVAILAQLPSQESARDAIRG